MIGAREKSRANIYRQLATVERAGVPLLRSLERMASGGAGKAMLGPLLERLQEGEDIGTAVKNARGFSPLESALIAAGSAGGTLPDSFTQLAEYLEDRRDVKLKLAGALAYPVFVMHLAFFLPNLKTLITGGIGDYLAESFGPLLTVYAVVGGAYAASKLLGKQSPRVFERIVLALPVIGGITRKMSLAVALRSLSLLYANGVSLIRALELAGDASPNEHVGDVFRRASEHVANGDPLELALAGEGDLIPGTVIDMISTGTRSGQLDTMLDKACELLDDEARRARTILIMVLGGLVFAGVAVLVAYQVISTFAGLYPKELF